jgi:hypothetical protein
MKNYLVLVLAIGFLTLPFLFSNRTFSSTKTNSDSSKIEKKQTDLDILKEKFEPAKKMLLAKGVPFDPETLLSPTWRDEISYNLAQMTELQETTLRVSDKLQGVQIADTIVIPEKVELTGDLVILANTVVFEGQQTVMEGIGMNVYVFPVKENFHIGKTFEEAMKQKGFAVKLLPAVNQRVRDKFEFEDKVKGLVTIRVNGQGYPEWLAKQKKMKSRDKLFPENLLETQCPQQTTCNGNMGGEGNEGRPGTSSGNIIPPPPRSPNGRCSIRMIQDGISGIPGDDGLTGPDNAGIGDGGYDGGPGGTIMYSITMPYQAGYVFESRGGQGGRGGRGGFGATGDNGQDGGRGGDGADCPCNQGGPGNGGNGENGGKGGKGGPGGTGGPGGPGGPGGFIFVNAPYGFNSNLISTRINGGPPGTRGEGGIGGFPGFPGDPGRMGIALGNLNCNLRKGMNGLPGNVVGTYGRGDRGPFGNDGTVTGAIGTYQLTIPVPSGNCQGPSGTNCIFSPNAVDCPNPLFPVRYPPCCCYYSPIVVDINGEDLI